MPGWMHSQSTGDKSSGHTTLQGMPQFQDGGQLRWNQAQDGLNIYSPQSEYMWNTNPNPIIPITPRQNQVQEADLAMDNKIDASTLDMRPKLRTDLGKMAMQSFTAPNILDKAPEAKRPVPNPEKQPGWTTGEKLIAGLSVLDRFIPERDPIKSNAPKMENTLYAPWNTPSYGRGSQAIAKHGLQIHGDYNMDDITRMEQGGELNIHWGGEAEPISYNPIDGQETVLFNGASHDNGGIGIDFQGNPVEVQGGEPAMKDEQGNLNILGGMQVPGQKYTFQTMGKKIAKQENKYTKQLDKGSEFVNKADLNNRFDILSMNTGKAMMAGATQKLKELSEKKQDIIALQNSILDTAKEMNLDPNALSKGKLKKGKEQKTAQWGALMNAFGPVKGNAVNPVVYNHLSDLYNKAKAFEGKGKNQAVLDFQKEYHRLVPQFAHQVLESEPVTNYGKQTGKSNKELTSNEDQIFGKRTVRYMQELEKYKPKPYSPAVTPAQPKKQDLKDLHQEYKDKQLDYTPSTYPLGSAAQDLAFYQVAPELAAFATNRVRPVPTFGIQQDLYQPYKISMQDQRNANAATFRAMQEQLGYNPTAMSTLAAQKYQADQQSLADEFRTNQGIEADIINKNLGIVNETRNKNLQLQADQWMKQEMARANTRKEDLGVLSSISNKIGQNKKEQIQIKLWENMFKYRPNSNWQMQWQGGDADLFAGITPLVTEKKTKVTEKDGDKTTQTTTTEKANGGIAKAVKRMGKYNSLG